MEKNDKDQESDKFNNNFSYIVQKKIGEILSVSHTNPIFEQEKEQQQKLLDWYSQKEKEILEKENISKNRVYKFIEDIGLKKPKNIIFLTEEDRESLIHTIPALNHHEMTNQNATYSHILELPIVFIDRVKSGKMEEENIILESLAIHEILHYNTGIITNILYKDKDNDFSNTIVNIRSGFISFLLSQDKRIGDVFEEGFSRRYQAIYKEKYHSADINTRKKYVINKYLSQESPYRDMNIWYFDLEKDFGKWNNITVDQVQFSGVIMDLLINDNPELEDIMIKYKKGNVDLYKKIIEILRKYKLKDGRSLYASLRSLSYNYEDFYKGYFLVKEAIEISKGHFSHHKK